LDPVTAARRFSIAKQNAERPPERPDCGTYTRVELWVSLVSFGGRMIMKKMRNDQKRMGNDEK
jgi:hypothetical protein